MVSADRREEGTGPGCLLLPTPHPDCSAVPWSLHVPTSFGAFRKQRVLSRVLCWTEHSISVFSYRLRALLLLAG